MKDVTYPLLRSYSQLCLAAGTTYSSSLPLLAMASYTTDFDVVRVQYESKVPIKVALERLDAEVKAFYQNKPGGHPKHFDGTYTLSLFFDISMNLCDRRSAWVNADLIDLTYPTDDWKVMNKEIQPAIGPSGLVYDHPLNRSGALADTKSLQSLDHNHHSHEYRALYQPNEPYLETHLYSFVPPIEDYSILYAVRTLHMSFSEYQRLTKFKRT